MKRRPDFGCYSVYVKRSRLPRLTRAGKSKASPLCWRPAPYDVGAAITYTLEAGGEPLSDRLIFDGDTLAAGGYRSG